VERNYSIEYGLKHMASSSSKFTHISALEQLDQFCRQRKPESAAIDDTKPPAWALNIDVLSTSTSNEPEVAPQELKASTRTSSLRTSRTSEQLKALFPPGLLPEELDPWADELYKKTDHGADDPGVAPAIDDVGVDAGYMFERQLEPAQKFQWTRQRVVALIGFIFTLGSLGLLLVNVFVMQKVSIIPMSIAATVISLMILFVPVADDFTRQQGQDGIYGGCETAYSSLE
jgi:hypothetical protein